MEISILEKTREVVIEPMSLVLNNVVSLQKMLFKISVLLTEISLDRNNGKFYEEVVALLQVLPVMLKFNKVRFKYPLLLTIWNQSSYEFIRVMLFNAIFFVKLKKKNIIN